MADEPTTTPKDMEQALTDKIQEIKGHIPRQHSCQRTLKSQYKAVLGNLGLGSRCIRPGGSGRAGR